MSLPGLILRPYRQSDFDALVAMDQACFPKTIAYGRGEMKLYLDSEGSRCIVAEIPGALAGFILTERAGDLAHIITLDVSEGYRRHSVGSLLLQAAEQESASQGCKFMYLETATTNKAAIALWRKHGYRQIDTVKNYYGRGQNAFEMLKQLDTESQHKVIP